MDLMDLLKAAGGDDGLKAMSKNIGIPTGDAGKLMKALSPALTRGIQRQSESSGGMEKFAKALQSGGHQRYLQDAGLLAKDETRRDGNKILGHLFGSKDVSRNVAAKAAEETGISSDLIKKALPFVATLVMGAVSKSSDSGEALPKSSEGGLGSLAGILFSKGGSGVDDILGLARKFF